VYKGKKICVVVPAYNEENLVLKVIKTVPEFIDHFIVVDDASADNTYQAAAQSAMEELLLCG
jgi:glycosyltransferase involved in cell wall biosynthesis